MASFRRALPSLERCERPRTALRRFSGVQPGRLAQGPEENSGRAGRIAGFARVVIAMSPILTDGLRPVGRAWPAGQKPEFLLQCKQNFSGMVTRKCPAGPDARLGCGTFRLGLGRPQAMAP